VTVITDTHLCTCGRAVIDLGLITYQLHELVRAHAQTHRACCRQVMLPRECAPRGARGNAAKRAGPSGQSNLRLVLCARKAGTRLMARASRGSSDRRAAILLLAGRTRSGLQWTGLETAQREASSGGWREMACEGLARCGAARLQRKATSPSRHSRARRPPPQLAYAAPTCAIGSPPPRSRERGQSPDPARMDCESYLDFLFDLPEAMAFW
jgi:hypothetical protein